jgi:hypothetical protein
VVSAKTAKKERCPSQKKHHHDLVRKGEILFPNIIWGFFQYAKIIIHSSNGRGQNKGEKGSTGQIIHITLI